MTLRLNFMMTLGENMYQHRNWQGALLDYPVSKVVCVGSNYVRHLKEMGSATPEEPCFLSSRRPHCVISASRWRSRRTWALFIMKLSLAVLISATLRQATEEHVRKAIAGYGVALDLTCAIFREK
ncbi:putative Fumarylacetoacetate (FAA) hydrolase family [Salmonella enterica subsp. arizonae]|uniref:Putative Fumarylacetoacetate (FAA) hydrolase family n=1 Tax=Salmonella enterica subsp. arizonae TaxID=59203 RepID=A0A379SUB5_SALER|nr:putative Fumarylacetoacetate (FAA) hydrolase family [Salmonella enterica subsp. arizonae]